MSKLKKLRKKFAAFASQLTPDECREQLVLAYLQMEKCLQVLRGEDVEPVAMMDNGESSDLELFYRCKKVSEELDYLNQAEKKSKGKSITIGVDVDCSDAIKHFKELKKEFEKFQIAAKKNFKNNIKPRPEVYVMKVDLKKYFEPIQIDTSSPESMLAFHNMFVDFFAEVDKHAKCLYSLEDLIGNDVWYMYGDHIQHGKISYVMKGEDGDVCYKTSLGHTIYAKDCSCSLEELMSHLKNSIHE